jgi:Thioredoxin
MTLRAKTSKKTKNVRRRRGRAATRRARRYRRGGARAAEAAEAAPAPAGTKTVLGKIYSEGCGHCQNMAAAWNTMKDRLPKSEYEVWEIEAADEAAEVDRFATQHGVRLTSSGYPTIFMVVDGKQVDYNGERDVDSLVAWATQAGHTA